MASASASDNKKESTTASAVSTKQEPRCVCGVERELKFRAKGVGYCSKECVTVALKMSCQDGEEVKIEVSNTLRGITEIITFVYSK